MCRYGLFAKQLALGALILMGIGFQQSWSQDQKPTLQQLTARAEVVAIGEVSALTPRWNAQKTRISTTVTIQIEEFLKGASGNDAIAITYPGGEIGEVGEWYSHAPRFTEKERALLFLRKGSNQEFRLQNGSEGKLTVSVDETTREETVLRGLPLKALKMQIRELLQNKTRK